MGKIEENKEKKRRDILRSAQKVFMSDGYTLASMDQIALQAQVTKQTVYRYYNSKIDLFSATLNQIGEDFKGNYFEHFENPDNQEALYGFANEFIGWHLSDAHIKIYRLLVAEGGKSPELTRAFFAGGPEKTRLRLILFFRERLGVENPETAVRMWIALLLTFREGLLMGASPLTNRQIKKHAKESTRFLLNAILPR